MSGINKVILVGFLGRDPEIRTFENGSKRASFSLATTEYRKDKDGNRVEMTERHNIGMWRNLADLAETLIGDNIEAKMPEDPAINRAEEANTEENEPNPEHLAVVWPNEGRHDAEPC